MLTHPNLALESYRTILESLPAAVYLVDRDRRIIFWNDGCERITGHQRYEVIGRRCGDELLMHCDEQNDVLCGVNCPLSGTMHDGRPREADVFLRHKHGQRVPVRVRAIPIRDEGGSIIGACECFDERIPLLRAGAQVPLVDLSGARDPATQLPDRHAVLQRIAAELRAFQDSHIPFGVLSLTLDDFDKLRAVDGANAVNTVLYATAQTLSNCIGPGNLVGRWSDRQFVATLYACTETTLLDSAKALKRLASLDAVPWWGGQLKITLSAGGTLARSTDTAEVLIARAESASNGNAGSESSQAAIL